MKGENIISAETAIQLMRQELQRFRTKPENKYKSEMSIRCPFCGDSKKDPRDMHLYIKMKPDNDGIARFPFNCKLCPEKRRMFNQQDIKTFDIQNQDLLNYLQYNLKNQGNTISLTRSNYIAPTLKSYALESNVQQKQQYLFDRLGSKDICINPFKYKIILDLVSFFKSNHLEPNYDYQNVKQMLRNLHNHCIGFLSFDNSLINFREIDGKIGQRYTQYKIYSEKQLKDDATTSGFYAIPGKINSMGNNLTLVMAEGSFDILRVYVDYFQNKDTQNTMLVSVSNANGYAPCITKFLEYGVMFDTIHIYGDDDVKIDTYKKYVKPIVPDAKILLHTNELYKDFGDKTKPLKENIEEI
jgi:hypothetical protein